MSNRLFFAGIIGGLGVALVLAVLFSGAATAQMIQHQQMQQHSTHQGMKHSMFKANGLSLVQNVTITGLAITGENEVTVNLAYSGTGSAPSVTLIAVTNHEQMMAMMMGGSSMGSMGGMMMGPTMMGSMDMMSGSMPGWQHPDMPNWNATQWQQWHSQMSVLHPQPAQPQSQSGSAVVESGWLDGGSTATVLLDGDTSAYSASDIFVTAFPHLT
jgi:hypothetical protein